VRLNDISSRCMKFGDIEYEMSPRFPLQPVPCRLQHSAITTRLRTCDEYYPYTRTHQSPFYIALSLDLSLYKVIRNYCRGFNNLSYKIHLR
jgi:hypothetical protein